MLSQKELFRQIVHIIVGLATVGLVYFELFRPLTVFLLIIVGVCLSFISRYIEIPGISAFLNVFERDEVRYKFPGKGVIFFFTGVLLSLQLFERDIALAAIMVLTLGDSISHIVGARIGEMKNIFNPQGNKLLEGTLIGSMTGFVGALLFVPIPEAFLGSLGAMMAEVVEIELNQNQLDDNLVVPIVAGTIMMLVGKFV